MRKLWVLILSFALMFSLNTSCQSKKKCADFSNSDKNYKANYNKKGLVKKKGSKSKINWDNY